MDKIDKIIGISLLASLVVIAALLFTGHQPVRNAGQAGSDVNYFRSFSTSSVVLVGTGDLTLLATSTARAYCLFSNMDNNAVFLGVNSDIAAVAYKGIMIAASSTFVISDQNLYIGAVHAITAAGTARLGVTCN